LDRKYKGRADTKYIASDEKEEVRFIVTQIKKMMQERKSAGIGILQFLQDERTVKGSRRAFNKGKHPYKIYGDCGFMTGRKSKTYSLI